MAGIARLLHQPLLIAHIITGIIVGPFVLDVVHSEEVIHTFSSFGITLLLFIIGLGLNPRVVREVGRVALVTGLGQIAFTSLAGYALARALGFDNISSTYIAIALTFSSTIIILKLLSDKKELGRLHGKIATGFLLVQDVVAALILIIVSSFGDTDATITEVAIQTSIKGVLIGFGIYAVAVYILPYLLKFFAKSQEFLFLFAIGWGFGVSALCAFIGFSIEIGALAAGVALASTQYSYEITSRMRPVRDFFIILFFIVLGAQLALDSVSAVVVPSIVFSLFILIGNPLIVMVIMGSLGYTKETSFKAGLTVAQISEFSLVLVLLGVQIGQLSEDIVALATLVGMITIAGSTYMILYADEVFKVLAPVLGVFERKTTKLERGKSDTHDIVLFGFKGGSEDFVHSFQKLGKKFLVVDYDPETVDQLRSNNIETRFGDAGDAEFLEELQLDKTKLVVINITEYEPNVMIIEHVRERNKRATILAMTKSNRPQDAQDLYERGANYVMMPYYQNATKMGKMIAKHGWKKTVYKEEAERHKSYLQALS